MKIVDNIGRALVSASDTIARLFRSLTRRPPARAERHTQTTLIEARTERPENFVVVADFVAPATLAKSKQSRETRELREQRAETRANAIQTGAYDNLDAMLLQCKKKFERLERTEWRAGKLGGMIDVAAFAKKFGIFVVPEGTHSLDRRELEYPSFRPTFLCGSYSDETVKKIEDNVMTDWVVIQKVPHEAVQWTRVQKTPKTWDIYEVSLGVSTGRGIKRSYWAPAAAVGIDPNGTVRSLTVRESRTVNVSRHTSYTKTDWTHSGCWMGEKSEVESIIAYFFNSVAKREMHWTVNVSQGDYRLSFSIPENDAPRFFRQVGKNGKRAFHSVAAHLRQAHGKQTSVATHYRGSRHFTHEGMDIVIQIPGLHRPEIFELPPLLSESEAKKDEGAREVSEFVDQWADRVMTR